MQVLEVSLEEVYRRDIKKVQFMRYERDRDTGEVRQAQETVLVPLEHQSVRFAGLGDCHDGDAAAGDAIFVTSVMGDGLYECEGRALYGVIDVSPYELCFGGRRVLPHPSGESIALDIRENFFERVGQHVVVPHYGLFDGARGRRNDLTLRFRVCVALDSAQMQALRDAFCRVPAVRAADDVMQVSV